MKDRIKQIMESQNMTQQVFANFIDVSPASLSSIFNDRTRPTLNIVEAIKKNIPNINTDWLMFGSGEMYVDSTPSQDDIESGISGDDMVGSHPSVAGMEMAIDFGSDENTSVKSPFLSSRTDVDNGYRNDSRTPVRQGHKSSNQNQHSDYGNHNSVRNTPNNTHFEIQKNINNSQRHITEIRIYFDDQTYETFVPSKK